MLWYELFYRNPISYDLCGENAVGSISLCVICLDL